MNTENKLKPKLNWPDEIRRKMVEKSEFYSDPRVYQFGYYDGFQKAIEGCDVLPSELLKQRDELRDFLRIIISSETTPISYRKTAKKLLKSTEVKH